jgi:hypothetical protein
MNTVEVRGAVKSYGKRENKNQVLSDLNMTVAPSSM